MVAGPYRKAKKLYFELVLQSKSTELLGPYGKAKNLVFDLELQPKCSELLGPYGKANKLFNKFDLVLFLVCISGIYE